MAEDRITVDFETRSELDVRDVGAWRYAEHHSTEILCLGYRLPGNNRRYLWRPGEPFPRVLHQAVEDRTLFEAHNASFERAVWIHKLADTCPVPSRWTDTQAVCAYRSLPLSLDEAGEEVDLEVQKDKYGKELIQKLCSPRKPLKKDKQTLSLIYGDDPDNWPLLWNNDEQLLHDLGEYCQTDVAAEHALSEAIGDLPYDERRVWIMDQIMNQRGVYVDLEAVYAAKRLTVDRSEKLTKELQEATDGKVKTGGQRDKILAVVAEKGYKLSGLTKDDLEAALKDPAIPDDVHRILEIRLALSRASTKKLDKIIKCTCNDGRLRGMFQYHGAGTGRVAGRLVQLQNLIRTEFNTESIVQAIKAGDIELLELIYGDLSNAVAESLRGMFIAAPGKILQQADFGQIETRVIAWLAGEEWLLEAFRNGEPIYEKTAEMIFGYKVVKGMPERQDGKTCTLAFCYQGGVGSWRQFDKSDKYTDEQIEFRKDAWRDKHPMIQKFWYGLEEAAISALKTEKPCSYRKITFRREYDKAGKWLSMELPSGRKIWHYKAELVYDNGRASIRYRGKDPDRQGKFTWLQLYGGKLANRATQGTARDLMMHGNKYTEEAGYPTIMTVHDEIVAEVDEGFGSTDEFCKLMSTLPAWAKGCPVEADGWRGYRYKK